jgi:hypothetical protein
MPVMELLSRFETIMASVTKPFFAYTRDLTKAWPLTIGEWGLWTMYNVDHYDKPAPDWSPADIWYQKSFLVVVVLAWMLLEATLRAR